MLLLIGVVGRLAPLTDIGGRLLRQFPTEDGYLMLTIARNIALGLGMTVSAGTVPTNGTQPLVTVFYALVFWLVGGDRAQGVLGVQLLQAAAAAATALVIFLLARRLLRERADASRIAAFAAAVWFASPVVLPATMNSLETGVYLLAVVLVVYVFSVDRSTWSWPACIGMGALLGAAFLVRNDAVFLIAVVCAVHAFRGGGVQTRPMSVRLAQSVVMGVVSIVVASPWLYYNVTRFGHLVPVSGRSEGLGASVGRNLAQLMTVLPEYVFAVVPVPGFLQEHLAVSVACGLLLCALAPVFWMLRRAAGSDGRDAFDVTAAFVGLLSVYYVFFFGAPWFIPRYLVVSSPFFAIALAVGVGTWSSGHSTGRMSFARPLYRLDRGWPLVPLLMVAFALGLNARTFARGSDHDHFQVVEWVERNVPPAVWVASPQSGTLGFFHDRTLNMDGKVSPGALEAREAGRSQEYAIDRGASYFVDWSGLEYWAETPRLRGRVELIVNDRAANLSVLRVVEPAATVGTP